MAVLPGILPISITRGVATEELDLSCVSENVTVTGTLSPNVIGNYTPNGNYNGFPLFILEGSPSTFIYVNPVAASYVIARILTDGALTDYWVPASPITADPSGTYVAHGANTGTATATDSPTNLTGLTAKAQIRRTPGSEELILDLNPSITDAVNGKIVIPSQTGSVTKALPYVGTFSWDLELLDASLDPVQVAVQGPVIIADKTTQEE